MFETICLLTGVVIIIGPLYAYLQTNDAYHPAVVVSPLFFYVYCLWPILLNMKGGLEHYISESELIFVATLYLLAIMAFFIGMLKIPPSLRRGNASSANLFDFSLTSEQRKRVFYLSLFLGFLSVAAFAQMTSNAGGFFAAYGRAKGGGWASSGYISEATLLSYPAVLLLAISRRGLRTNGVAFIALASLLALQPLVEGTFGGRRGPLFLVLALLFFSWFVAKGKLPSLPKMVMGIAMIGFAIIVVSSQRQHLYLGSGGGFESQKVLEAIIPEEVSPGNTYLTGAATVITSDWFEDQYWGYRYFVTFFIRPIPKQIWPTKYEDVGANWLRFESDFIMSRYIEAVGFAPPGGVAMGAIADGFQEFSWGVVVMFFLLGRVFALAWRKHRVQGGVWTVVFMVMLILSIYLPTQSFSAWAHRLLFISIATILVWKYWIGSIEQPVGSSNRNPSPSPSHL